jgi:hypothetical protein
MVSRAFTICTAKTTDDSRLFGDLNVKRLSTGIPRLDKVLGGGLPVGSLTLLAGAPGPGKTILAQQICFHNATAEHKAVYYSTISEPPEKFISHLEVFDFFDRAALVDKVEFINLGELLQDDKEGEKGLWTFAISNRGFEVRSKLEGVTGLLGWSALRSREAETQSDRRRASDRSSDDSLLS